MAIVRLSQEEIDQDDLPPVCMRCGEPATDWPGETFRVFLTRGVHLSAPLCRRHARHWLWRRLMVWTALTLMVGIATTFLLVASYVRGNYESDPSPRVQDQIKLLTGSCVVTLYLLPIIWIVGVVVLHRSAIHAIEITSDSATFTEVAREFAVAVRQKRRHFRAEGEEKLDSFAPLADDMQDGKGKVRSSAISTTAFPPSPPQW
jgi:hypothetical protein